MRTSLLTLALVAGSATAQNEFMIYPERNGSASTFTDRLTGGLAVEIFQEVPGTIFAGVGDLGGTCLVRGIYHMATDHDASTPQSYHIVLRSGTPVAPGPDPTAAGIIARAGPFMLPTGTGRMDWMVSQTFATPITVPCSGGFYMGLDLPAAPNWSMDGHSCWVADYVPQPTWQYSDNPRAGAPNHAWRIISGVTSPAPRATTLRLGLLLAGAVLNIGGIDPASTRQLPLGSSCYGAGGIYPDVSGNPRRDGLDARVEDSSNAGGTAHLLLGIGIAPVAITIPGFAGRLWLHPAGGFLYVGGVPITGNVGTVPIVMPATLPSTFLGQSVSFQGLTVGAGGPRFTNLQVVSF